MKSKSDALSPRSAARLLALAIAAAAFALPAQALYKVVGPDGKITYTDRPPSASEGKVMPLTSTGSAAPVNPNELPPELRQVVARYPVTLYVVAECTPCDSARALLRQRGIPFAERIVSSDEDIEAVQRLIGSRDVPSLTLGTQVLRGFSPETWTAYLDTAGYPRESRLPPGYTYAAATPVTQRAEPAPPVARPPQATAAPPRAPASPAPPAGIRF